MKVTEDILPLTELRSKLTEKIEGLSRGSGKLVVTRNGRPAAVVLSPEVYDQLQYEHYVRSKIARSLSDAAKGRVVSHEEVMDEARALADAKTKED
jgi:prevent-host-death family protein